MTNFADPPPDIRRLRTAAEFQNHVDTTQRGIILMLPFTLAAVFNETVGVELGLSSLVKITIAVVSVLLGFVYGVVDPPDSLRSWTTAVLNGDDIPEGLSVAVYAPVEAPEGGAYVVDLVDNAGGERYYLTKRTDKNEYTVANVVALTPKDTGIPGETGEWRTVESSRDFEMRVPPQFV